jgi:hypothetical protein
VSEDQYLTWLNGPDDPFGHKSNARQVEAVYQYLRERFDDGKEFSSYVPSWSKTRRRWRFRPGWIKRELVDGLWVEVMK